LHSIFPEFELSAIRARGCGTNVGRYAVLRTITDSIHIKVIWGGCQWGAGTPVTGS